MNLKTLLDTGQFVITSEIGGGPQEGPGLSDEEILDLRQWADTLRFSVAGDPTDGCWSRLCRRLKDAGFGIELEVKVRDHNRYQVAQTLLNATAVGIENVLVFSKDYCISGESLPETMFFAVDLEKFFSVVKSLEDGLSIDGKQLNESARFCVGARVDYQSSRHARDHQLREMESLARHNVAYFVTRPVFDVYQFAKFVQDVRHFNVPIIAEVLPVSSSGEAIALNSGSWMKIPHSFIERLQKAEAKSQATADLCADLIEQLKAICAGIHVIPFGNVAALLPLFKSLKARSR